MFELKLETQEVTLNDGSVFTIREASGQDEDTLSKQSDVESGSNIPQYLASIIVSPKTTVQEIKEWPISKKYLLLVYSRILSQGESLEFQYPFTKKDSKGHLIEVPETIEVNLTGYLPNFKEYFSLDTTQREEALKNWNPVHIKPITSQTSFEKTLRGYKFRFNVVNTIMENLTITSTTREDYSINNDLRVRELSIHEESGEWVPIQNFRNFPAKMMTEFRLWVEEKDPRFKLETKIINPYTRELHPVNLLAISDFFYPGA